MSKLIINDGIQIPFDELQFSNVRSSGPGGQNVNKVNTKVVLRWNIEGSAALPDAVRQRLLRAGRLVSKDGWLIVTSQRHRYRQQNYDDCLHKLRVTILDAAKTRKQRKATRPTRSSQRARRREKQINASKKRLRQLPKFDD